MDPGFSSSCAPITLGAAYQPKQKEYKHASFPPFQWSPKYTHSSSPSTPTTPTRSRHKAKLHQHAASKGSGAYPSPPSLYARRGSVQAPPAFVFHPATPTPSSPPSASSGPSTPSKAAVSPVEAATAVRLQHKLFTKRSKSAHDVRLKRPSCSSATFSSIYGTGSRASAGAASTSSSWLSMHTAAEEPWLSALAQTERRHSVSGSASASTPTSAVPLSSLDDAVSVTSSCSSGGRDNHSSPASPSTRGSVAASFQHDQEGQDKTPRDGRMSSSSSSSNNNNNTNNDTNNGAYISSHASNDGESDPEQDSDLDDELHAPVSSLSSRRSSYLSASSPVRAAALRRDTHLEALPELEDDNSDGQQPDTKRPRASLDLTRPEHEHEHEQGQEPCCLPAGGNTVTPKATPSTSSTSGEEQSWPTTTVLSNRSKPDTLNRQQIVLLCSKEADVVFRFDDVPEEMRWDEAMKLRKQARQQYLRVRRGRRASRIKGKRVAGAAARSKAAVNNNHTTTTTSNSGSSRSSCGSSDSEDTGDNGAIDTSCPYCNKSYRQNNSFFKHLYEHHPQWQNVAETFNMSKHQQAMMMQTAELLLSLRKPLKHGLQPLVRFDL